MTIQPTNKEKFSYFEQLVQQVNKIDGITISLSDHEHNPYKDALAFCVEEMSKLYPLEQSKLMLEGFINKVSDFVAKKKNLEARLFIDQQVSALYEAVLCQKKASAPNGEKGNWEQVHEIYQMLKDVNSRAQQKNRPVEFGGVNHEVLPDWYTKKYIKQ